MYLFWYEMFYIVSLKLSGDPGKLHNSRYLVLLLLKNLDMFYCKYHIKMAISEFGLSMLMLILLNHVY